MPQRHPTLPAELQQVVRGQLRQLHGARNISAAGEEIAKVAPIVCNRGLRKPSSAAQKAAMLLKQFVVGRLVGYDRRDCTFLAKHSQQVRQAIPHMLLSPARRPSVAAANRQVSVDEVVDDLLVESSVYISLLRV